MRRPKLYFQAPVGNESYTGAGWRVHSSQDAGLEGIADWEPLWLASGTTAIAAAVMSAINRRPVPHPRVVVPGYGCPDLVAGMRKAGAQPIYVDVAEDSFRYCQTALNAALREHDDIVAVIGVDLFGIREDWQNLSELADKHGFLLIQDCAQSVQSKKTFITDLQADAVVLSFGRGKPVCCLGGGCLLLKDNDAALRADLRAAPARRDRFLRLRSTLYNILIRPTPYAVLAKIMGDRLGATRYIPLDEVLRTSASTAVLLNSAMDLYWQNHKDKAAVVSERVAEVVHDRDDISFLQGYDWASNVSRRLSRLPLLVENSAQRSALIAELREAGISATTMYSRSLPEIVGRFDGDMDFPRLPNAMRFAEHLITLPVHGRLTDRDIERMGHVLKHSVKK